MNRLGHEQKKSILSRMVPPFFMETLLLYLFTFVKIPSVFFTRPKIVALDESHAVIRIPLSRRTRNHIKVMYMGVLVMGADLACGILATVAFRRLGVKPVLLFSDISARFLKRAEGDVHFTCAEGQTIEDMVSEAARTGERVTRPVKITATVPAIDKQEPVAEFELGLTLKLKPGSGKNKNHST